MTILPWLPEFAYRIYTPATTLTSLPCTALPMQAILAAVIIYYNRKIWLLLLIQKVWTPALVAVKVAPKSMAPPPAASHL